MNTVRIALYTRVSTGGENRSEAQMETLRAYADSRRDNGWTLSEENIFSDIASASESDRPGLAKLKDAILWGKIDTVLIDSLDRLFRKNPEMAEFINFLKEHETNLVSLRDAFDMNRDGQLPSFGI